MNPAAGKWITNGRELLLSDNMEEAEAIFRFELGDGGSKLLVKTPAKLVMRQHVELLRATRVYTATLPAGYKFSGVDLLNVAHIISPFQLEIDGRKGIILQADEGITIIEDEQAQGSNGALPWPRLKAGYDPASPTSMKGLEYPHVLFTLMPTETDMDAETKTLNWDLARTVCWICGLIHHFHRGGTIPQCDNESLRSNGHQHWQKKLANDAERMANGLIVWDGRPRKVEVVATMDSTDQLQNRGEKRKFEQREGKFVFTSFR